jgi:WD40 repeat protein
MAIAFSPDGEHLVSGYVNGRLTLWDAADGLKLSSVLVHDQSIDACAFSPDGATILTASGDSTLKLWDVA